MVKVREDCPELPFLSWGNLRKALVGGLPSVRMMTRSPCGVGRNSCTSENPVSVLFPQTYVSGCPPLFSGSVGCLTCFSFSPSAKETESSAPGQPWGQQEIQGVQILGPPHTPSPSLGPLSGCLGFTHGSPRASSPTFPRACHFMFLF